jgi:hypothetical protein
MSSVLIFSSFCLFDGGGKNHNQLKRTALKKKKEVEAH